MEGNEINVKIYLKKNKYIVKLKSSHLKGEIVCKNAVELDSALNKITYTSPDVTFYIKFSQGALGRYSWEIDSPLLLYKLGYKFMGYVEDDIRLFYNDELSKLIVIDEEGRLKIHNLN